MISAWFIGEATHSDFEEVVECLKCGTQLRVFATARDAASESTTEFSAPELLVIAQSRPGSISLRDLEILRRRFPLVGVVSLAGSWCEGELRTGRPITSAIRLYWYEFPIWWRRQLAMRSAGRCADWARPIFLNALGRAFSTKRVEASQGSRGLIIIDTPRWETADALADLVSEAGYASVWQPPGRPFARVRGAVAGIWEGGQLDECEADELSRFCERLSHDAAPVVALLDFPRRAIVERARNIGAACVLGKPWGNAEIIAALENLQRNCTRASDHVISAA